MFNQLKENKKHIAVLVVFTIIFLFFSLNIYSEFIGKGILREANKEVTESTELLQTGDKVIQPLNTTQNNLCQVDLYFATYNNSQNGNGGLRIRLIDVKTEEVLAESILPTEDMYDNQRYEFKFPKVDVSKRQTAIVVEALDIHKDATIAMYTAEFTEELKEPATFNQTELSGPLRLDYRFQTFSYQEQLILFSLVVLYVLLIAIYCLVVIKKSRIHRVYLLAVLVLGMIYMLLIPGFTTPDERTHVFKALEFSNQLMGYDVSAEHFELRQCEADMYGSYYAYTDLNWNTYEFYYGNLLHGNNNGEMTAVEYETIKTPQYQYILTGLGITLGRLMNLNALATLTVGMLFNFACYVLLTVLAVKWIPFGKVTTAIICLLPISLQQATSFSYDCLVIPLAVLFVACLIRVLWEKEVKNSTVMALAITAMFFLPTKQLAYMPVVILLVYAFFRKWKTNRKLAWKLMGVLGIALVYTGIMQVITNMQLAAVATDEYAGPYIEWARQPGYSIGDLLASPVESLNIIWNTLYEKGSFYFMTTFGGQLSWMSVQVSVIAVYTYFVASIISVMPKKNEAGQLQPTSRVLFFVVFFLCVMCIVGGMLLGWTPVSMDYVEGVQGRYFLPVLLFGIFAFRGKEILISEKMERACFMAVLLMQPFTIAGILYSA